MRVFLSCAFRGSTEQVLPVSGELYSEDPVGRHEKIKVQGLGFNPKTLEKIKGSSCHLSGCYSAVAAVVSLV
jgi:hypothetical protein